MTSHGNKAYVSKNGVIDFHENPTFKLVVKLTDKSLRENNIKFVPFQIEVGKKYLFSLILLL